MSARPKRKINSQQRAALVLNLSHRKFPPYQPTGLAIECGSSVLFDENPSPKMSICAGTLDAPTGIREKAHIYAASKGDYYEILGDLLKYDTFPQGVSG